jgi:Domain of unknown function (DUF1917)/HIRAN domain
MSSNTHRLKLSYDGGSQVLSIEPTMTLQELGQKAKEIFKTNAAITLSTKSNAGLQTVMEWQGSGALVRDAIPKMSLVQCVVSTSVGTTSTIQEEPPPKKAKTEPPVVDLMSDSDEDDDKKPTAPPSAHATDHGPVLPRDKDTKMTLDDPRDPTTVTTRGDYWIWQPGPQPYRDESILGKWLIFRSADTIAQAWTQIAQAVQSGSLQAAHAKVATHYHTSQSHHKNSYVLCVYTSEPRRMSVGHRLIEVVQHDIRYQTDETTALGLKATSGIPKVTHSTLYWNHGRPSTTRLLWTQAESLKRARQAPKNNDDNLQQESFQDAVVTVQGLQYCLAKHHHLVLPPLIPVQLVREPHNSYDGNAIRVELVPNQGSPTKFFSASWTTLQSQRTKVGFLAKEQAQALAPWMDRHWVTITSGAVMSVSGKGKSATIILRGRATPPGLEMLRTCFAASRTTS